MEIVVVNCFFAASLLVSLDIQLQRRKYVGDLNNKIYTADHCSINKVCDHVSMSNNLMWKHCI